MPSICEISEYRKSLMKNDSERGMRPNSSSVLTDCGFLIGLSLKHNAGNNLPGNSKRSAAVVRSG
jgi:hypothetical protein